MTGIVAIVGFSAVFVAGSLRWYRSWHRRVETALEKVPVRHGHSARVLRQGVGLGRDGR